MHLHATTCVCVFAGQGVASALPLSVGARDLFHQRRWLLPRKRSSKGGVSARAPLLIRPGAHVAFQPSPDYLLRITEGMSPAGRKEVRKKHPQARAAKDAPVADPGGKVGSGPV